MSYSALRNCPACAATNRVPARHLTDTGRCGSCKAALPPVGAPLEVDQTAFQQIVQDAKAPVFVDFWAAWCGPCRMAAPEVEGLAKDLAGRAIVLKVDTEHNAELAGALRIQSIPTFMVFQNGQPAFRHSGLAPRVEMRRWVEQAISEDKGTKSPLRA